MLLNSRLDLKENKCLYAYIDNILHLKRKKNDSLISFQGESTGYIQRVKDMLALGYSLSSLDPRKEAKERIGLQFINAVTRQSEDILSIYKNLVPHQSPHK